MAQQTFFHRRKLTDDFPVIKVHRLHQAGSLLDGAISRWDFAGQVMTIEARGTSAVISIGVRDVTVQLTWHPGPLGGAWPVVPLPSM